MTEATAPLLSLAIDPRARLVLFDVADDPTYVAMEVQVFDDDRHGRGVLALLARHDAMIDIFYGPPSGWSGAHSRWVAASGCCGRP